MRFFLPGILLGILINPFVFTPKSGRALIPLFTGSIEKMESIEPVPGKGEARADFPITTSQSVSIVNSRGMITGSAVIEDGLFSVSGNGRFFARYEKVGDSVEYFNIRGERFWKIDGREYPYLSSNGKIILLMNGDHTVIRIADYNGNITGAEKIVGRLCTSISFSDENDRSVFGFLDGSYHVLDNRGKVTVNGTVPEGFIVKGCAVSSNGLFAVIHYGNPEKDFLRIINCEKDVFDTAELDQVHPVKSTIHVNGRGDPMVFERDFLKLFSRTGRMKFRLEIYEKRPGYASLTEQDGIYAAGYTGTDGIGRFMLVKSDGSVLSSRPFSPESFIKAVIKKDIVFLRGSDNLYCYRLHQ